MSIAPARNGNSRKRVFICRNRWNHCAINGRTERSNGAKSPEKMKPGFVFLRLQRHFAAYWDADYSGPRQHGQKSASTRPARRPGSQQQGDEGDGAELMRTCWRSRKWPVPSWCTWRGKPRAGEGSCEIRTHPAGPDRGSDERQFFTSGVIEDEAGLIFSMLAPSASGWRNSPRAPGAHRAGYDAVDPQAKPRPRSSRATAMVERISAQ